MQLPHDLPGTIGGVAEGSISSGLLEIDCTSQMVGHFRVHLNPPHAATPLFGGVLERDQAPLSAASP
jgi:hypothetical protein